MNTQAENLIDQNRYEQLWKETKQTPLQSWQWGEVKSATWQIKHIELDGLPVTIMLRKFPLINKYFGYVPRSFASNTLSAARLEKLKEFGRNLNITHLIVEPELKNAPEFAKVFRDCGFVDTGATLQPNDTQVVDLRKTEDELMADVKPSSRKLIRRSEKFGVGHEVFGSGEQEALDRFFVFMDDLYSRTDYVMQGKAYFQKIWDLMGSKGLARIYIATMEGKDIGASFSLLSENGAYDLYGGIGEKGRYVKAGYYLKWRVILDSKAIGKEFFDHWGAAPVVNGAYPEDHPLYRITLFKECFGGEHFEFLPQQTFVFSPLFYNVYRYGIGFSKKLVKFLKIFRRGQKAE